MKSRIKEVAILEKQGKVGKQKAGELKRMLAKKLLNDPEFFAAVEARIKQEEAEQAKKS